jgi:hypothetical protein
MQQLLTSFKMLCFSNLLAFFLPNFFARTFNFLLNIYLYTTNMTDVLV